MDTIIAKIVHIQEYMPVMDVLDYGSDDYIEIRIGHGVRAIALTRDPEEILRRALAAWEFGDYAAGGYRIAML